MSYNEYNDMFESAQKKGKYLMHVFDVKDSKKISSIIGQEFYERLMIFTNSLTKDLLELEKQTNTKILHRDIDDIEKVNYDKNADINKIILNKTQRKPNVSIIRDDTLNPIFWLGDLMQFTVLKGSISDEKFLSIVQKNKDNIIPNYNLHYAKGYYETDDWTKGDKEYFRGYCALYLSDLSKKLPLITTKDLTK